MSVIFNQIKGLKIMKLFGKKKKQDEGLSADERDAGGKSEKSGVSPAKAVLSSRVTWGLIGAATMLIAAPMAAPIAIGVGVAIGMAAHKLGGRKLGSALGELVDRGAKAAISAVKNRGQDKSLEEEKDHAKSDNKGKSDEKGSKKSSELENKKDVKEERGKNRDKGKGDVKNVVTTPGSQREEFGAKDGKKQKSDKNGKAKGGDKANEDVTSLGSLNKSSKDGGKHDAKGKKAGASRDGGQRSAPKAPPPPPPPPLPSPRAPGGSHASTLAAKNSSGASKGNVIG